MNYQRFILFRFPQEEITSQRESLVPSAKQGSQHPHSVSKMQSLPQNKNTKLLKGKSTTLQPRIIRHVSRQRVTDNFPAKHVSGAIHINWYKWGVKMCVLAGLCLYTCAYLANPALFPKNLCLINIFELSSTSDSRSKQKSYIVHCCVYICWYI